MTQNLSPLVHTADAGRRYVLGKSSDVEVVFRADGDEIGNQFAVTEWWMDPGAPGLDSHVHADNHELIYVLSGEMSILVDTTWTSHAAGSLVFVPSGTAHGFRNDSAAKAGVLNVFTNGAYEAMMPQIQAMFATR